MCIKMISRLIMQLSCEIKIFIKQHRNENLCTEIKYPIISCNFNVVISNFAVILTLKWEIFF